MKELDLNIFPHISREEWKQIAEKQLKGGDPDDVLRWKNDANLELLAYYDLSDREGLHYLTDFFSSFPTHTWKLYEEVRQGDPDLTNHQILDALMGGCDGVIINLKSNEEISPLLKEVNTSICDICIISQDGLPLQGFSGFHLTPGGNCYHSKETSNPIKQVVDILVNIDEHSYIYRTAVTDFFLEIATLRALHFLLAKRNSPISIHTHVPLHPSADHQWFLNTTAGLASILGGTHSVDFSTATGNPRISRNTGNLIREESGIVEYTDPCGGSYYLEVLTDKIIKQVEEKLNK